MSMVYDARGNITATEVRDNASWSAQCRINLLNQTRDSVGGRRPLGRF